MRALPGLMTLLFATVAVGAPAQDTIFEDGFEAGSQCAWSNDLWYLDLDSDHYGDRVDTGLPSDCPPPADRVPNDLDCDDLDPLVNPAALERCDGLDNDCDDQVDEDFDLGQTCGLGACAGGTLVCRPDGSGTICTTAGLAGPETCDGVDNDCDGTTDEGFAQDTNPSCSGATALGAIAGDASGTTLSRTDLGERFFRFSLLETNSGQTPVTARVDLTSPYGVDFDLYVYCASCGGSLAGSSTVSGPSGHVDTVFVRADDQIGLDDSIELVVEVRYAASDRCGTWSLTVMGNVPAPTTTCP